MGEAPRINAYQGPDESAHPGTLFVSTVYEDEPAADCARRLMSRILKMASHTAPVQDYAWSFDVFDQPDGMAAAARRAAAADVLVVAAYRDSPAISRVAEWLTHWLAPSREKEGALVAVIIEQDDAIHATSLNESRLSPIAREIGMDFFSTHVCAAVGLPRGISPKSSPHE